MAKKIQKRVKKKVKRNIGAFLIILVVLTSMILIISQVDVDMNSNTNKITTKKERKKETSNYNDCLKEKYSEDELNDTLKNKINEVNEYVKQYNVYVKYEDLTTNFSYGYRENESLYGASLIKIVDAIYLLDNDIDLNQTKKYTSNYKRSYSYGMDHEKINSDVKLNTLLEYALTLSDNSAHEMLYDFIGSDNLKAYAKSLGAKHILEGSDKYGNQSAQDMSIYLKRAYELFASKPNGEMIKSYMLNYYQNNLYLNDVNNVAHKYGSYNSYYHDVGIVYDEKPYTIAILTQHGYNEDIIRGIHAKIKELHDVYQNERIKYCQNKK